jgi:hypothetical protein
MMLSYDIDDLRRLVKELGETVVVRAEVLAKQRTGAMADRRRHSISVP